MIVVTDGTTTFGIVHYALMLEYWDYTGCIEYVSVTFILDKSFTKFDLLI